MTLPIGTSRLLLRNLEHIDLHDILDILAHPSVARVANVKADDSLIKAYIDKQCGYQPFQEGKYYDLAVEHRTEAKVIGLIGMLCEPHQQGAIGWVLGFEYRGNGYAFEGAEALIGYAFSNLRLHRIYAKTNIINIPLWKLMERLGMRREAHLRETEIRDDQWIDMLIYAIFTDEWVR